MYSIIFMFYFFWLIYMEQEGMLDDWWGCRIDVRLWSFFLLNGVRIEFDNEPTDFLLLILRKLDVPLLSHSFLLLTVKALCCVLLYLLIELSNTWGKYFLINSTSKILWTDGLSLGSNDNKLYVNCLSSSE